MNRRILMIDDEPYILDGYTRNLGEKFEVETASKPEAALAMLSSNAPYAVVISDLRMPGINGVDTLKKCKEINPDTVRIMISGNADLESAVDAVNEGSIFRILTKPCPHTSLVLALEEGVRQHQLITAERELLNQTLNGSVQVMVDILSLIDSEAFGKATFRREVAKTVALAMGLQSTWDIEIAALLADIGRVTIPAEIIRKRQTAEPMSSFEKDMWLHLPEISARLLSHVPRLEGVARIVHYQNKNFDGSGFPENSTAGESIPIGARILKAVNGFLSLKKDSLAMEWLASGEGFYDPAVVDGIRSCLDKIRNISTGQATATVRKVELGELQPGQKLCSDIRAKDGMLVMAAGLVLQQVHIEKIINFANLRGIQQPLEVI